MSALVEIVYVPENLREKLGEQGTKELVDLLNRAARGVRESTGELAVERLERRLAGAKSEIVKEIAAAESRLVWKMLAFWLGQAGLVYFLARVLG